MTETLRALLFSGLLLLGLLSCSKTIQPTREDQSASSGQSQKAADTPRSVYDLDDLPDHPVVVMSTSKGDITIELDNVKAPISTANFRIIECQLPVNPI